MKMKKRIKNWCSVVALGMATLMGIANVAEAYSTTTSGRTTISPTNTNFKNASSPMYINKTQTIDGTISSAYEMDIYHYECQEGGYYQVYTTKSLDTVGAVYEEENSLFSSPTYERIAFNDVGKITSADNFSMVIDMDKWEDYYVCVRGYDKSTGAYRLNIEPNQDRVYNKNYGIWECEYMPSSAAVVGVWTNRKIYITEEQAILYYWMLDPATEIEADNQVYTIKQLKTLYKSSQSKVVSILSTALSSAVGVYSNALGITTSIVGLVLSEELASEKSADEVMRQKLVDICGVKQKANATTWSGKWSAVNGMLIKETYTGTLGNIYSYSYSKFNGTYTLTGEKWYYGKWKH